MSHRSIHGGRRDERGVTLTEIMVVLAIFAVVTGAVFAVFANSQNAYFLGAEMAEVQGDARVALDQMAREIAKAGRDVIQCSFDSEAYTDCSGAKLTRCQGLLGGGFTCSNVFIVPSASATSIKVQMDLDGNGAIDTSSSSQESITFAYDAANKRITRQQGTGSALPLAENIQNLTLAYEGPQPIAAGVCTGAWGTLTLSNQTARDCIQRVTITIVAQSQMGVLGKGPTTVSRTLRTSVDLRAR